MNQRSINIKAGQNVEDGKDPEKNVWSGTEGRAKTSVLHGLNAL